MQKTIEIQAKTITLCIRFEPKTEPQILLKHNAMTCITYNFHTYTRIFHFFKINYLKNRKLKFSLLDSQLQQEKVLNRRNEQKKTFTTIFCNLLSKQNLQSFHHNYANSKEKLISQMIISKQKKKEKTTKITNN